jgi:uncharacterized protein (TIGR03067 family)
MTDALALQGSWEQIALEADGHVDPPDELGSKGSITMITGDRFVVRSPSGDLLLEGSFTIDGTVIPKAITWIDSIGPDAGKQLPAIYTLQDDVFAFIASDEGEPRPTEFRTRLGQTMRTFVRRS